MAIIPVDPFDPEPAVLERAAGVLRGGGLVAFPTETVYGLGANALDERAVRRIFVVKGRPATNPLIVHVPDAESAQACVSAWPATARRLADAFWPGPLTLVLPKRPEIPGIVTAGLPTAAVRVPDHPVARALMRTAGLPLAAPSANRSGQVSPTTAQHVEKGLGDAVDLILDAGATSVGIESTVVDLSGPRPVLLRPGTISAAELERRIGPIGIVTASGAAEGPRASPGMRDRHYAPRAELRLFDDAGRNAAAEAAAAAAAAGRTVGALLLRPLDAPIRHTVPMPRQPDGYARTLYAALHSLDDLGCELILVELVPPDPPWHAVRDRLTRAAG